MCFATAPASRHPPKARNCMNSRSSDRCGTPSLTPPFSLRSGGSMRARPLSILLTVSHGVFPGWRQLAGTPAVGVHARMAPHEWIFTGQRPRKGAADVEKEDGGE